MIKYLIISIIILFINNCSINKVVKHHGVHQLEIKQKNVKTEIDNINDIKNKLGPPSSKNGFDDNIWIYLERKTTVSNLKTFGKKDLLVNNILILEFDKRGILKKKNFLNKDDMKEIKFSDKESDVVSTKENFINTVLQTLRKKINDPLGKRRAN